MQLDLFSDSRDVMLRNDVVAALRERDCSAGGRAHAALAVEYPDDRMLAPARILLDCLATTPDPFADHAEALQAVRRAESETFAAAVAVFGSEQAGPWMQPVWHTLAVAVAHLSYRADAPEAYSAHMLIRAGRWAEAASALERIESWRRIPQPLAWMAEVQFRLHGLDVAWPLLAELAWRDPARFAALAEQLPAPALVRLLRDYGREFSAAGEGGYAWFPAWALIAEPRLDGVLRTAQTPERTIPEQACRTVVELLSLERQGRHRDIVEQRRRLRMLHAELFAYYMQTRS
jgi:hypothetical protein